MVDSTLVWPQPETLLDDLEHRFKQYEKSDHYNPRLTWDEECVKMILSGKYPLLRAFALLLSGIVLIAIDITQNSGQFQYWTLLFGVAFLLIGLGGLRGNLTLEIHENHLGLRYDRANFTSKGMENPDSRSTEIKTEDITVIKYIAAVVEHTHTKHHNHTNSFNESDYGTSTTTTSYEKISVTRIWLALSDEMKEFGMEDDENPWFDIRSKTKVEAEKLAEALNFLILRNSD
tara:strand:+ start:1617 stop:2312 length:696 start_codon:yes stop_codon:yes gene_type:complete